MRRKSTKASPARRPPDASATEHSKLTAAHRTPRADLREGLEKLAELLVEALHQHGEVLTKSEKELADENRQHLSEVETALSRCDGHGRPSGKKSSFARAKACSRKCRSALVDAAENTVRQQEQLVKQGDVLLQVVDATGQVKRLEETLNENLAAVQRAATSKKWRSICRPPFKCSAPAWVTIPRVAVPEKSPSTSPPSRAA